MTSRSNSPLRRRWVPPRPGAKLTVFRNGRSVGTLEKRGPSRYRFAYSEKVETALSVSLPLREKAYGPSESAPFFEGLLPEGSVRRTIAERFRLSEGDGFGLLAALGADCAGAVVLLPEGEQPDGERDTSVRVLGEDELSALVDELPRHPLGVDLEPGDVRLSLGGVQDKLVLVRLASGEFGQPLGGAPSTCLLKPDYGRYEDLAVNEAFCMRAAAGAGLDVAVTELIRIGATPCLYVERFDREEGGEGRVFRLHQEDVCQALGILPSAKYEASGGPSVAQVVALLRGLGSALAALDVNRFLKAVLLNFLLGNSDAHGKNFALLYDRSAGVRLAPLYDLVSTAVYPELTPRMAMSIGGAEIPEEVDVAAWDRLAKASGLGGQLPALLKRWAADVIVGVQEARQTALEEGWHRPVIDRIVEGCWARRTQLGV
ncbi:MAG TPA: type II toxin-antitoxin system HipA family toxin [Solirubrobacterales bacterium]